jgi:uncharacterized oxidoreductase
VNLSGNTILITGGASGIGLAFAERFLKAGNQVLICGRRPEKLAEAQQKHPQLRTRVCDVGSAADRLALFEWAKTEFPALNVLVNNAGIQHRGYSLTEPPAHDWSYYSQEIAINVEGLIHLSMLFTPLLADKPSAAIINVSSGLAFTPMAAMPIYCATKAAVHSFTMSLRHQAAARGVSVVEVVPPAVNTDLGGPGIHTFGAPVDEFADAIFAGLARGDQEIGYGGAERSPRLSREEIDQAFARMNAPRRP